MIPRKQFIARTSLPLFLWLAALHLQAEVKLHGLFSDHMVLQRDVTVPVWGWAKPSEEVTVEFRGQKLKAKATADGSWTVRLKKLKAGGPDEMKISSRENTLTLQDVMVGEVWIASGQSNMEWPLSRSSSPESDIKAAQIANLRLFTVPKLKADAATNNVKASWQLCTPETVPNFSAVGFYFGRDLQKALNVPVGVIHTSWGGSPAEVWMSDPVLKANADYKRDIVETFATNKKRVDEAIAQWEQEQAAAKKENQPFTKRRPGMGWKPSELYNGMIAPLIPYAIKGAIWYQGESNAGRAHQYRTLFPDMIRNWRKDWKQGDFTFLLVQLAPFKDIKPEPAESDWAELREAQLLSTQVLPKVGLAVITDVGEEKDIHPRKKEPVGARLALAARKIAYGEDIVHSGPQFKKLQVQGDRAVLTFDHVGGGLEARGDKLTGFAIAGADKKFVNAQAAIEGNKIVVTSPDVKAPVAVRFGWADYPVVNLWNKEGLPATPFRTDDFTMITAPKK